ncbi:PAS domain S-box-containing protein/diguanylate cyclase (GGDEF) domain-containing protein [Paenibacillus sp. BC26]|nr:PAS domain S-box-containing protein/diguanylate cyclase (GGDEF) domain-containing protein [Paenibacillus sp. BC26]
MATSYEQFSSKLLTYTLMFLILSSLPIYVTVLSLELITFQVFIRFVSSVIPLGFVLYFVYRQTYKTLKGKLIISAYSFLLCSIVMCFIPTPNSGTVVFLFALLSLIYLDRYVTLLASGYGIVLLIVHQLFNPYMLKMDLISRVVQFTLFTMCCITCVSVCIIGRRIIAHAQRSEKKALDNENRYRQIFELSPEANIVQIDNKIVHMNRSGLAMLGAKHLDELIGVDVFDLALPEYHDLIRAKAADLIAGKTILDYTELRIYKVNGEVIEVETNSISTLFNNRPAILSNFRNISETKNARETINYMAYHDQLTDLPNRYQFIMKIEAELRNAANHPCSFAVLFLDMDRFKSINDTFGHPHGDRLLKNFAKRLQASLEPSSFAARLAGDEFVILLPNSSAETLGALIEPLLERLSEPFILKGQEISVTTSIGIAMYPKDGQDADTLLIHADAAMYAAKRQGRNNYAFYSTEMNEVNLRKMMLEQDLRKALQQDELHLVYQGKKDLSADRLSGFEALLRWTHPKFGAVSPAEFIPLAEETGLIVPIGEWVVRQVCDQINSWKQAGLSPLPVSVNLSVRQFKQDNLIEMLKTILLSTGIEPRLIDLEITESVASSNFEAPLIDKLHEMKALGVSISIDDFGTGYSSLSYLRLFPVDTLKMDKCFIRNIDHNQDDLAIVTAIIGMAHSLKLQVLAEGVENETQLALLKEQRCDGAQGYLIGYPVAASEVALLLAPAHALSNS